MSETRSKSGESISSIEENTIQQVPLDQRHGRNRDMFTIWFGTNIMILAIVTGALATTVFGQPAWSAALAIVLGNLFGAIFMALHSAQGPTLGVPQMVQTKGQFGSWVRSSSWPVVVCMYTGFFISILVFGGESLASVLPFLGVKGGILILACVSIAATIWGYTLIHAYARVMTWASGITLVLAFVWAFVVHPMPADFFHSTGATVAGFLGTFAAAAVWQIAYAPYVSDYSRYLPKATGAKPAFWMSYWGTTIGSILPMLLGAGVGLLALDEDPAIALTKATAGISVLVVAVFSVGVAATNAMNLYCGTLCTITILQTFFPKFTARARERAIIAACICRLRGRRRPGGRRRLRRQVQQPAGPAAGCVGPVDRRQSRRLLPGAPRRLRRRGLLQGRRRPLRPGQLDRRDLLPDRCRRAAAIHDHRHRLHRSDGQMLGVTDISFIVGLVVVSPLYYFTMTSLVRRQKSTAGVVSSLCRR